jgi:hypothetical protein
MQGGMAIIFGKEMSLMLGMEHNGMGKNFVWILSPVLLGKLAMKFTPP